MIPVRARLAVFALLLLVLVAAPAAAVKRRAFVTSVQGNGNLNSWPDSGGLFGVAAGDNICRVRAAAAGLPNAATYRAWLSTPSADAYCHVRGQTGQKSTGCVGTAVAAGPWYRYDGVGRFTGTLDELTGPEERIYQPIRFDENGGIPPESSPSYWTGTGFEGQALPKTCAGWVVGEEGLTGSHGAADTTTERWTWSNTDGCHGLRRLLCLEPGASEVTPVPWVPAALVFTTSTFGSGVLGSWPEAGGQSGLAAGDAICRNLAAAARLPSPQSFFAWLSSSTVDAADRMTLEDRPFRRVDGFRVADSKADLLSGSNDNTLHVDEWGRYLTIQPRVWTGTSATGTADPDDNCLDWVNGTLDDFGLHGWSSEAYNASWTDADTATGCPGSNRLYCFSNREVLFWDGFDLSENTERWSAVAP